MARRKSGILDRIRLPHSFRQHRLKDPAKIRFVVDQLRTTPVCGIRRGESVWMLYYRPGISLKIPISRFHLFNSGLYGMYVHLADVCALYVHCHHPLDPPSFSLYRTDQEWTVFCYVFSLLIWLLFVAWGICCCIKCLLVEEEPERDGVNASHTISKKTMPSAIYVENPEGSIQVHRPLCISHLASCSLSSRSAFHKPKNEIKKAQSVLTFLEFRDPLKTSIYVQKR